MGFDSEFEQLANMCSREGIPEVSFIEDLARNPWMTATRVSIADAFERRRRKQQQAELKI